MQMSLRKVKKIREKILNIRKLFFYCEGDQTLTHITQRGGGQFVLGDIQNPSGHGPEQPSLGGLA